MSGNGERKISSLRDLPRDITPPRDLWQGIEARIQAGSPGRIAGGASRERFGRTSRLRVLAAAAMIAMLAVGIWIGRAVLPGGGRPVGGGTSMTASNNATPPAGVFPAAFVLDPKYTRQRAALVQDLEARLQALPPDSRTKVINSLKAINDSKQQLEHELGKDPSNALLQELLVNTYQDEMRLLTTVHEAGRSGEGI